MNTLPVQAEQSERFILGRIEQLTYVFPSTLVAEVLLVERSHILALPFYDPAVLGIIHHTGQILPLISMRQIVKIAASPLSVESMTVIRLSQTAEEIAGIGLVIDRVVGSVNAEQLSESGSQMKLFQIEDIRKQIWQLQRWRSKT